MMPSLRRIVAAVGCIALLAMSGRAEPAKPVRVDGDPRPMRLACLGDSITYGTGLGNAKDQSYPAQLAAMLGPRWDVQNFGVPGVTCLAKSDSPLWRSSALPSAMAFDADVVIIMLGTNDSKTNNWVHADRFVQDYVDLIGNFTQREVPAQVWICLPPPLYGNAWGLSNQTLEQEVIPKIRDAASKAGVSVIDLNAPLKNQPAHFPDNVHPDSGGASIMAAAVYQAVAGQARPAK